MKRINKILCGIAVCASALAISSCKTETIYVLPEASVTRLTVSPLNTTMGFVDNAELSVTIRPSHAKYQWISDDESIAVVDENNRIVPTGVGTTTLTAKAGNRSFSVQVSIHSSIVGDSFVIENGKTAKMESVQVLPEGIGFQITNQNEQVATVSDDLTVTALQEGVGKVVIRTEDNISQEVTIGVTDGQTTTMSTALEALYEGGDLEHGEYGFSVLMLGTSDAVYEGDTKWSGSGKGLAYKLYRNSIYDTAPDGIYRAGETEYSFYNSDNTSYIVNPETGTKEYIKSGYLVINGNDITANVITASKAYVFKYSGARPTENRRLLTDYTINIDEEFCDGNSLAVIDEGGTRFFSGYTWMWQLRFTNSAANTYLLLFAWGYQNDISGDYTFNGQWTERRGASWVATGTSQNYCTYREGSTRYYIAANEGGYTISNYQNDGTTVTATVKGTAKATATYNYTTAEIGVTNSIPVNFNINVTDMPFTINNSKLSN